MSVALNEGDFLDDLQTLWRSKVWVGGERKQERQGDAFFLYSSTE